MARIDRCRETTLPLEFPFQCAAGHDHSVLYIEDDEVNIILMEQLFATRPGWRLQCAPTGAQGIAKAALDGPRLIMIDMNLPDMSGADVFDRLKEDARTRSIPCVAVSANAMSDHIERVLQRGFVGYWTKPLDLPATIRRLMTLLR